MMQQRFLLSIGLVLAAVGCGSGVVPASAVTSKASLSADASGTAIVFKVTTAESGLYYLRAWSMGGAEASTLEVVFDDEPLPAGTLVTVPGWQFNTVYSTGGAETFALEAGTHGVTFKAPGAQVPEIDAVEVSLVPFSDTDRGHAYARYTKKLVDQVLSESYVAEKRAGAASDARRALALPTAAVSEHYCYELDKPFTYTYRAMYYFAQGESVVFETRRTNSYASDPVLYLFNYRDQSQSFMNDDYNGLQSRLAVTIPTSGFYVLLARSYSPNNPGTSDLYRNDSLVASNIPLAGAVLRCALGKTGSLNYFTSYLSGDTVLFVADTSSNYNGVIRAFNDDYYSGGRGDFYWGLASRVHLDYPTPLAAVFISAYSTYRPSGVADVYMQNADPDLSNVSMAHLPYLKLDDVIEAVPVVYTHPSYNCISYSGGLTDSSAWPPDRDSPWYDPNPQIAFDKFYGNQPPRYPDAITYTRSDDTGASTIDLWFSTLWQEFTHASVRKPGNRMPHGYAWESKMGTSNGRIFHPREAIGSGNQAGYGVLAAGYVAAESQTALLSVEAALSAGTAVLERPMLDVAEATRLATLGATLPSDDAAQLAALYEAWRTTWSQGDVAVYDNPARYTKSRAYRELIDFCVRRGNTTWPYVFERFLAGDDLARLAIHELTRDEFGSVLDDLRAESAVARYTSSGKYVVPSAEANTRAYIKAIARRL